MFVGCGVKFSMPYGPKCYAIRIHNRNGETKRRTNIHMMGGGILIRNREGELVCSTDMCVCVLMRAMFGVELPLKMHETHVKIGQSSHPKWRSNAGVHIE